MINLLLSLLFIVLILGVFWIILKRIPIPADLKWIVEVVFLIIAVIALMTLLSGGWHFPVDHFLR